MTGPSYPEDWSSDDQVGYERYLTTKACRNTLAAERKKPPEPVRDPAGWREARDKFQAMRRDGDAFRDQAFEALGLDWEQWRTERHQPTPYGPRRYDIGRRKDGKDSRAHERVGYELKLGGGDTEFVLTQLEKDEFNLDQGWDLTWFCNDRSKLSKAVHERLTDLEEDYPDRFRAYDLEKIRSQGAEFQPQNEHDRQAQKLARMQFTPPSRRDQQNVQHQQDRQHQQGGQHRQPQANGATAAARQVPEDLQQTAALAAAGQNAPATAAPRPRATSRDGEAIRTGAHQAALQQRQARGNRPRGAMINDRALNGPSAHRAGRDTGSGTER